ncbi:amino acid permease [Rhodococcus sp. NPDC056960]|uniref:amino acid permease n=1 Tax=Rhodococcus sp. NPDC056960 TaxID=3345982 RepID=UPI0036371D06
MDITRISPRPPGLAGALRARKSVEAIVARNDQEPGHGLKRSMGLVHLTALSIGASLGTGIFVILGEATPKAGPAVVLAFVLAAFTALFSALSYAELAGSIPVSGSSYSYTYATMGELFAWICGWCLMLEYGVSVAAVAVGWGEYINELLQGMFGIALPTAISESPGAGGVVNVPAIVIVLVAVALLTRGASESALVNTIMVALKILVLVFFCAVAFTAFRAGNFAPFMPLGAAGVTAAASQVFFAYIGFDAASTAGDEAKNAKRDLPRAIILSLLIVTILYCLVAIAAVGAMPWQDIAGEGAALATILDAATTSTWPAVLLSAGAVIAIASVVLAVMYGQTRILYAMSLDGLVPRVFSRVNPRTRVPVVNIVVVGGLVSALAGFVPLGELADATSIGSLFAFMLVNVAVIILRRRHPDLHRSFRTPLFPLMPVLGVVFCALLLFGLGVSTWVAFALWMVVGLAIYFAYGVRKSELRNSPEAVEAR